MTKATSATLMELGAKRILPFERVALVLQGGGALGAYQAGVYQAIDEARIGVHWLCGTSIGGINAALIAGNPPQMRVERLREFWEAITRPPINIPNVPWFSDLPWNGNGQARYWTNRMSAFATMFHGAPDFFKPRPFPPVNSAAESPEDVGYYDTAPLKATLERLVDFDLIERAAQPGNDHVKRPNLAVLARLRQHHFPLPVLGFQAVELQLLWRELARIQNEDGLGQRSLGRRCGA